MCSCIPEREEHCVAAPIALHWPSSLPEEVATGLAGILTEVWKSPPPPPETAPRSWGTATSLLWAESQSLGSSRRRWHRCALISPYPSPGLCPGFSFLVQCPFKRSAPLSSQSHGPREGSLPGHSMHGLTSHALNTWHSLSPPL